MHYHSNAKIRDFDSSTSYILVNKVIELNVAYNIKFHSGILLQKITSKLSLFIKGSLSAILVFQFNISPRIKGRNKRKQEFLNGVRGGVGLSSFNHQKWRTALSRKRTDWKTPSRRELFHSSIFFSPSSRKIYRLLIRASNVFSVF